MFVYIGVISISDMGRRGHPVLGAATAVVTVSVNMYVEIFLIVKDAAQAY